jgi:hypothetical protein
LLKILIKTIILKIIIIIIYNLFNLLGIVSYFYLISYFICACIFYGLFFSKDRLISFLILIYILNFWLVISDISNSLDFNFITYFSLPASSKGWADELKFSIFLDRFFNNLDFVGLDYSHESENLILISPENLNSKIEKLIQAINTETKRSGGQGPQNPKDFLQWILKSGKISEEESNNLLESSKKNELKNFYKNIPKFLKYAQRMEKIYIYDNKIYLAEFIDSYLHLDKNNIVYNSVGKPFYYFISISDLFNSELKIQVDIHNQKIIPMDKIINYEMWNYFKDNYFIWFIELNSAFYINDYIYFRDTFNNITPNKFMFSKYLSALEYSEEYDILFKCKIWYEHYKGIKHSYLSESILNEYREFFIKFWINQIIEFNNTTRLNDNYYIPNMYDINIVYAELLENIIFAQCKTLEAYFTINTVNNWIYVNGNLNSINTDSKIIDFYNDLFEKLKTEIIEKYKDVYILRREYFIERWSNSDYDDILLGYENLKLYDSHLNFTSNYKLNKDIFYKTKFPYNSINKK